MRPSIRPIGDFGLVLGRHTAWAFSPDRIRLRGPGDLALFEPSKAASCGRCSRGRARSSVQGLELFDAGAPWVS